MDAFLHVKISKIWIFSDTFLIKADAFRNDIPRGKGVLPLCSNNMPQIIIIVRFKLFLAKLSVILKEYSTLEEKKDRVESQKNPIKSFFKSRLWKQIYILISFFLFGQAIILLFFFFLNQVILQLSVFELDFIVIYLYSQQFPYNLKLTNLYKVYSLIYVSWSSSSSSLT